MSEQTLAILRPRKTRIQARKVRKKLSQKRHMIDHLAERINLPPQAALDKFASELGGPLQNMARPRQGGGRNPN